MLEHGANDTKLVCSIPIWTIHLRVGLDDPHGSLSTQNTLRSVIMIYDQSRNPVKLPLLQDRGDYQIPPFTHS